MLVHTYTILFSLGIKWKPGQLAQCQDGHILGLACQYLPLTEISAVHQYNCSFSQVKYMLGDSLAMYGFGVL